ncbi:MAG: macrolide family glycosyltransferase [Ktedonobacterales bacterium]
MAKYAFMNFPNSGQVNPTLAVVAELVARGEEVLYFLPEPFRETIESIGAQFRPYDASFFRQDAPRIASVEEDNRRLARLPFRMLQTSRQMVPPLLSDVADERPDCLVYGSLFIWARMVAYALGIPGVALRPTYAPIAQLRRRPSETAMEGLSDELAYWRGTHHLPFSTLESLARGEEGLVIVFLPRAFQPSGDSFDNRYVFVGPSFRSDRDHGQSFPLERLIGKRCLYISLGTMYNNQAEFYNICIRAFGHIRRQVILSLGNQLDRASLRAIPENFLAEPRVPQLEILARAEIFISHGGMNSTMESLYFGVPLIVIPHTHEQHVTAERVAELGLGIALSESEVTEDALLRAVSRIDSEPDFKLRVQEMQQQVRQAGGYLRATDALQDYVLRLQAST